MQNRWPVPHDRLAARNAAELVARGFPGFIAFTDV